MSDPNQPDDIRRIFEAVGKRDLKTTSQDRIRLDGLDSSAFEHPRDRKALDALRKTPALPQILRAVFGNVSERSLHLLYLAHSVRVASDQFPRVHSILLECCEVLDLDTVPDLFVAQTPLVNAGAIGMDNPFIVLNSGTIDLFTEDELRFVIGHELGHVMSGHVLYKTLLKTALRMTLPMFARIGVPIAGLAVHGLVYALMDWDRHSEFSGDRAGLLCVQSPMTAYRALMKTAGGSKTDEMSVDAFMRQAAEYEASGDLRDSALKLMNLLGQSIRFPCFVWRSIALGRPGQPWRSGGTYPRREADRQRRRAVWMSRRWMN